MFTVLLALMLWVLSVTYLYKPLRFYIYSFFFPWLYEHPTISKFLGIRYEDDTDWATNRKESRVYLPGITVWLLKFFIGMDFLLEDNVRKTFERIQLDFAKDIDMRSYFRRLDGKTINLVEFEDFLSKSMIQETNRVFNIIDTERCDLFVEHSKALRTIISAVTFSVFEGLKALMTNLHHIIKMSVIIRSVPEHKRVLLLAPQLALIHNFSQMVIDKRGDMVDVQPHDFMTPISKIFVAVTNGDLVFVSCHQDKRDTPSNRAFGPKGLQCPGASYTFKFVQNVIGFIRTMKIDVRGIPRYEGGRFSNISNKEEILFTFGTTV
jgi:hypothetical protein